MVDNHNWFSKIRIVLNGNEPEHYKRAIEIIEFMKSKEWLFSESAISLLTAQAFMIALRADSVEELNTGLDLLNEAITGESKIFFEKMTLVKEQEVH